jgi:hypothetical protein
MWTRILLDDLLVDEDSRFVEITSVLSHPLLQINHWPKQVVQRQSSKKGTNKLNQK